MKKLITMLVAVSMLVSVVPVSFAEDQTETSSVSDNAGSSSEVKAEFSSDSNDKADTEKKSDVKDEKDTAASESTIDKDDETSADSVDKSDSSTEISDKTDDTNAAADENAADTEKDSKESDSEDKEVKSDASGENDKDTKINDDKKTDSERADKEDKKSDKTDSDESGIAAKLSELKKAMDEKAENIKEKYVPYLKEIKSFFKDAGKHGRDLILKEIAAIKDKLGDITIDTFVNGTPVDYEKYDNVKPVIENDRTVVPVRAITESIGAEVSWDEDTRTVTVTKGDTVIKMVIDSAEAYVNGEKVDPDADAHIVDGRTIVPLRFVAESLNLNVTWDDASRTVIID